MSLRKLGRKHAELDALSLYSALNLGDADKRPIEHPERVQEFIATVRAGVESSLSRPSTVYGWHAQNFFGALVVALDAVRLLKEEDAGQTYFDGAKVKVPDWSVVLADGRHILVEVKSVGPKATAKGLRISSGELSGLEAYANHMSAESFIACYWTAMNMWTLTPVRKVASGPNSRVHLHLKQALMWNEMALIGDRMLGLVPPLEFRIIADPDPHFNRVADGQASFTIASIELWCGHQKMENSAERNLVWFLLNHSDWTSEEKVEMSDDGSTLESIRWTLQPEEILSDQGEVADQGFAIVGAMSSIYSSLYLSQTSQDGQVTALANDPEIGMIPRLVPSGYQSPRLPMWHFIQQPHDAEKSPAE